MGFVQLNLKIQGCPMVMDVISVLGSFDPHTSS